MTSNSTPGLARFNTLTDDEATTALHEVCASAAWGRAILSRRPYTTAKALLSASDAATAALTTEDLADAMAGHPPIGRPKPETRPPPANSGAWPAPPGNSRPRCSN